MSFSTFRNTVRKIKMTLNTQQQMLVEQRLTNEKKSTVAAYLLWFFLGGFGAHRFYLSKPGTAVLMLVLNILGWVTLVVYIGVFLLIVLGIWLLVDAFLIPGIIAADADSKRAKIMNEVALTTTAET